MTERYAQPAIIHSKDTVKLMRRLPSWEPPFSEDELQEILREHPEILPIGQLGDKRFYPLICIGRETDLGKGCFLDNLYVSPQGYFTLVETKLWKNPEQRREVVGQIIEYSKQFSTWDYSHVDRACKRYTQSYLKQETGLYAWVKSQYDEVAEETEFINTVNRSLAEGNFKLLIVGEGIKENTEELVEYLHETPHLRFSLALVELCCYGMDKEKFPYLMVPHIVARTVEIERAVVTINMGEELKKLLGVEVSTPPEPAKPGQRPPKLEEADFYRKLAERCGADDAEVVRNFVKETETDLNLIPEYGISTLNLKMRNPKDPDDLKTAIAFNISGSISRPGGFTKKMEEWGFPPKPAKAFIGALNTIYEGFHLGSNQASVPFHQIKDRLPEIKAAIQSFIEEIQKEANPD